MSFLDNVNNKAIGLDVKAEVYNQGVKREGVEASGVEQLAVMQGSGHQYQETKHDGGRYSASTERCAKIITLQKDG